MEIYQSMSFYCYRKYANLNVIKSISLCLADVVNKLNSSLIFQNEHQIVIFPRRNIEANVFLMAIKMTFTGTAEQSAILLSLEILSVVSVNHTSTKRLKSIGFFHYIFAFAAFPSSENHFISRVLHRCQARISNKRKYAKRPSAENINSRMQNGAWTVC